VLKAWVREQSGPRGTLRRLRRELPDLRYALEQLPGALRRFVEANATAPQPPADPAGGRNKALERRRDRYALASGAALLIAGAVLLGLRSDAAWFGWALAVGGLATLWMSRPRD